MSLLSDPNLSRLVAQWAGPAAAIVQILLIDLTLAGDNAVCGGFFELHPTQPLQIADRLGYIRFIAVEK